MDLVIKYLSNVKLIGSKESTANHISGMSKAAGKFNFTIGASVKKKSNDNLGNTGTGSTSAKVRNDNSRSITQTIRDCTPEDAARIGTFIFNTMAKIPNSDAYVGKMAAFATIKKKTLDEFHVQDYNELTKEQRVMYAQKMIAQGAPFYYTERSIHIKYGNYQTIYSLSHRKSGVMHWKQETADKMIADAQKAMGNFDVTLVKIDNPDPQV